MKAVGKLAVALTGLVLSTGCASNRQMQEVSKRVADLERGREVFQEEAQGLRTRSADLSADFASLKQSLRAIEGRMEGLERMRAPRAISAGAPRDPVDQQTIDRLLALQNRVLDIERRLGMTSTTSTPTPTTTPVPTAVPAPIPTPAPTPTSSEGPTLRVDEVPVETADANPLPPPVPPSPQDAGDPTDERQERYRVAYRAFREGRFGEAREEFTRYLAGDPDAELADNAQFWIADSFYAEKKYEDALVAYDRVIKDYPKGDKVPQALLKQAYCFLQLEYPLDARVLLKRLVDSYPDSDEAKIARDKLRTLPRR